MILGDRYRAQAPADGEPPPTVDDLFRRALARRPDAVALIDPPNRAAVTDGPPRRLTFAEADRIVTAIAARLRELGLPTDSIVAMQLPNTVESVLTLLGVLRAGLIAAPLPLLWRQADAVTALGRIGARALVTCQRIGRVDHGEIAMQVAAETFQIRFVGAYGDKPADGLFPLDDLMRGEPVAFEPPERAGQAADHLAVVTFDVTGDGIVPVARSHAELLAAGLAVVLEGRIEQDAVILGALATASLAGLATMVVPWLHSGGTLALHHPFAPAAFAESRAGARCTVAAVPGPLALRLMEAGLLGGRYSLKAVIAAWRTPERMAGFVWPNGGTSLIDVPVFGEIGLVPGRRNAGAKPAELPSGRVTTPRGAADAPALVELVRLATGSLAMRGAMVPKHAFPPGAARAGTPHLEIADDGFVDTGYACRSDKETRALMVDGPPSGIVSVGGYRFVLRELQDRVARIEEEATLAALPDSFAGHRLAGVVLDGEPPLAAIAVDIAAAAAASGGAYVPIVARLAADRAPPQPHALPVAPQARADVLIARLRAALRVRTLSSTALRRQETLADHGRVMASLPVGDPLDDATVLVAGRGGRYPALTTAVGSRLGLIGAFSLETALGYLNARDVDAVVIGDGFNRTMVDTFLAELGLDPRWRDLPVLVLDEVGIDIDPERMPLFDRVDGGADLVAARVTPFARLHALSSRLRRLVAALDAKGLVDPETGLLTADAFMRDLGRAMADAADSGTGLAVARISLDTLGEPRASRDAARIVGRLTRTGDFACRDRDGTILVAFVETDLTTAHVVARRIASVLKHTTLAPGRDRSGLDPTVVLASLKTRDSIDTLIARVGIERLVAAG